MIQEKKQKTKKIIKETNFKKKFRITYLSGKYSNIFLNHQKGVPLTGEKIIKIEKKQYNKTKKDKQIDKFSKQQTIRKLQQYNPSKAWTYFVNDKFKQIWK